MRFFGLYFAFFCCLFLYLFKGDVMIAAQFGADMLFLYFVFTSAISVFVATLLLIAFKKGLKFISVSPFFSGLFTGAAEMFFGVLLANRIALLFGAYMLSEAVKNSDTYAAVVGVVFLVFGYFVFRPFDFDFIFTKKDYKMPNQHERDITIDVEVVEDSHKLK